MEWNPPTDLYKYPPGRTQILNEGSKGWEMDGVSFESSVQVYLTGADYPMKGLAAAEAIWAINTLKRIFIEAVKLFSFREFMASFILLAVGGGKRRSRLVTQLVAGFNRIGWSIASPYVLSDKYATPCALEVYHFIAVFLRELGVEDSEAHKTGELVAMIFEYDNAYRYRLQDMFNETEWTLLMSNPRKEIRRLVKLFLERDTEIVGKKVSMFVQIASWVLLIPSVKNAFRYGVDAINFRLMVPDEIDKYWMSFRKDYLFFGKTLAERKEMYKDHNFPPNAWQND